MFDKIYERLKLVNSRILSKEEKHNFEDACIEMSVTYECEKERVIDAVYSFLCCEFSLEESVELTRNSFIFIKCAE